MKNILKLAFGTALFFSAWASAHADLTSSSPKDGATLSQPPTEITMSFSGDVRLAKVMLHSDDGKMHPLDFSMNMTPKVAYEIAVKNKLAPRGYTVYWTAMGGDSHKISGDFSFEVK
ncbi:Copper resistance protein CopC [Pseudoalteromonas sp. SW0106-04]|uniref:copper resistance CopC family protein n=1 Tax=Pseudoalteromonas sp. SW0106-04 TaxID=1702169 RepID=UPI0006B568CF|nr:copper resistance CopC family protein [Pseudoalteromonas sp. SW0106-04]GAP75498.1 Copper resistance protein CopC [Pseudoalteromonas sp. SW0106-04]